MAEGASVEGPHKVLILEHTLDLIFSHLPGRDWKTARLVCKDWNDRVLDNFDKKLKLCIPGVEGEEEVDKRMLTSISVGPPKGSRFVTDLEVVKTSFDTLCSTGYLEWLRALELKRVGKGTLDYLISVANEGCLRNVKEISLSVILETVPHVPDSCFDDYSYEEEEEEKDPLNLLMPDALPALKHFSIRSRSTWCSGGYNDFCYTDADIDTDPYFRAQIQSFLTAAPNLESLKSNLPLDLEGNGLRRLTLEYYVLLDGHKAFQMINQVKGTLRMVEVDQDAVAWHLEEFKELLPPSGKLREIVLTRVQISARFRGEIKNVESLEPLLTSDLSRLTLVFHSYRDGIPHLRKLLELVETWENSERREVTVLEIRFSEKEERIIKADLDLDIYKDDICFILEKLGGRWDLVRLISSKFRFRNDKIRPKNRGGKWTGKEMPVFERKNLGRVQIIRPDPVEDDDTVARQDSNGDSDDDFSFFESEHCDDYYDYYDYDSY